MIATAGAGRMGRSIALALALAGHEIAVLDLKERPSTDADRLLAEARAEIEAGLTFLGEVGIVDAKQRAAIGARIAYHGFGAAADAALHAARFVFEAVTETRPAKEWIFKRLSEVCAPGAVIASTSSTFSADELAALVTHPKRFIVTHWLNPAYLIPLVEVSASSTTSEATTAAMRALLKDAGKVTVLCKSSPGFIVPRIQVLAMNEAARIVSEGVATAEDVDTAIRYGFGLRYAVMGLLEFIDLGGLDILYHASHHMRHALGEERFAAPAIIDEHMAAGNLGLKSGSGFFDWSAGGSQRRDDALLRVVGLLRHLDLLPAPPEARFAKLIETLTAWLGTRPLAPELASELNAAFPPESAYFRELAAACTSGLDAGWLGNRGEPPLRYGRIIKPSEKTNNYSIDVVAMSDVAGPHHEHPNGEIDMVIPRDVTARFDGHGAGWVVYAPGSAHSPTVTGGTAAILYALPGGAITF